MKNKKTGCAKNMTHPAPITKWRTTSYEYYTTCHYQ